MGSTTGTRTESQGPSNSEMGRQETHRVVTLQVSGVRQNEIRKGRHFALEGITHDQEGNLVFPSSRLSLSIFRTCSVFMDEFHAILAMKIMRVSMG